MLVVHFQTLSKCLSPWMSCLLLPASLPLDTHCTVALFAIIFNTILP